MIKSSGKKLKKLVTIPTTVRTKAVKAMWKKLYANITLKIKQKQTNIQAWLQSKKS